MGIEAALDKYLKIPYSLQAATVGPYSLVRASQHLILLSMTESLEQGRKAMPCCATCAGRQDCDAYYLTDVTGRNLLW